MDFMTARLLIVLLLGGLCLASVAGGLIVLVVLLSRRKEPANREMLSSLGARRRCPQCGTEVRPDAPEGLCPQCLLKEAMKSESDLEKNTGATAAYPTGSKPQDLEELGQCFPQLEILELLGQGGMGRVYKARQRRLDRLVALKILGQAGGDAAFAERFAREARALARLTHPSIVTVHDFGESNGRFYLLMEFVDGVNLRHLLREGRLRPEQALQIVPQICEALQYAHEQGVVHRDIKPENILLDRKGRVKIADFGLAKLLGPKPSDSALTGSQQIMGTLHYMAPEQMERPLTVDHRADIYSLGVVFYEMLTGELPLGRFSPPSQKVKVDTRLDEVVLRALEKEPERRYQQASEVKGEVDTIARTAQG
jgi:serine/threonine protein kinase